jgi:SAM-dependent methyltransferase
VTWRKDGPQGHEVSKIRWELVPYTRGRGLDLGCGPEKAFPHFRGIDSNKDAALFGIQATGADFIIPTCEVLDDFASASQDFIFSSHLLEHIENHEKALREWWRVLRPGGHLCLYLPHKDFYPNIGTEGANPDHKHDFHPDDIIAEMKKIGGWDLVENQDRNEGDEYSFFLVFKKYADAKTHRYSYREPKPAKTCAIVRYGAWGDVIQMTSILPALKEEGYHVTLYTVPRAHEAIKHEPLIDKVILQDTDQVPNLSLGEFFAHLKKKYDKFINLCESVEGSLLAMPGRAPFLMAHEARHAYMNHNYLEFTHKIAEVKFTKPHMRFVASQQEKDWARKERAKFASEKLVMWVLRGSAVHKVWSGGEDKQNGVAGLDGVILRTLATWPTAKVILVGDKSCKEIIEAPWAKVNEPRVILRSGVWDIRQTMAMAQACDMVIGPETGVLSAVAMEPMKKIVFLSHSSVENLTRDWVNTVSLYSKHTPCYPCHKQIYSWDQCVQDGKSGIAQCQADIPAHEVWDAIRETFAEREAA